MKKTDFQWREECNYIDSVAEKRGRVREMNNSLPVFIRYCTMQRDAATRDGQNDAATYIQHIVDDMGVTAMFLHGCRFRPDGTTDNLWTKEVPSMESPMPHHVRGLSWTASGYGKRIPSRTMVFFNGRWRRVYVCQYSNSGTAYIGKWIIGRGAEITVSEY